MTNKEVAKHLKLTASLIDLTGGNAFRARAMANAARTLERVEDRVVDLVEQDTLTDIRGIGGGLAAQIKELIETGSFSLQDELLGAIPPGLLDMMRIKGLGAKKVRAVWQKLQITSVAELEEAAASGRLATIDGFGAKSQESILEKIQLLKAYDKQRRYADVVRQLTPLLKVLESHAAIDRVETAGELRRHMEVLSEADLLVATGDIEALKTTLTDFLGSPVEQPDAKCLTGTLPDGHTLRVFLTDIASFGSTLWQQTGPASHCDGFINQYGDPGQLADEMKIYETAGIAFIPPEIRDHQDILHQAAQAPFPALITVEDLRGTLHNHSRYSDGAHTLEEMAEASIARGLSYLGICDHSRSLVIANGMPIERVQEQQTEIAALNEKFAADGIDFRIFSGIESDILLDGSLDYPDEILATFDLIVASVHTRLNMPEEEATERVLTAVRNPYTTILGHPTGRLLLRREGYQLNYDRILDACAEHRVAIELNANPYRLDLDWRWIRAATDRGILISINPDAHSIDGLDDTYWGVEVARKGILSPSQCLNAMPLDTFANWLEEGRPG